MLDASNGTLKLSSNDGRSDCSVAILDVSKFQPQRTQARVAMWLAGSLPC